MWLWDETPLEMPVAPRRRWPLIVALAVLVVVSMTTGAVLATTACSRIARVFDPRAHEIALPAVDELTGRWCTAAGDVLLLDWSTFRYARLSAPVADELSFSDVSVHANRAWNAPPPRSGAGSWEISQLTADLLSRQMIFLDLTFDHLDGDEVTAEPLETTVYREPGAGWWFALDRSGAGEVQFTRCA